MRVCVCLDLVLLLVRWVSVKRITAVSLLYPHTLSQRPTFTRPTFHAIQPPSSASLSGALKNLESYLECQGQSNQNNKLINKNPVVEAGLKWGTYVHFLCPTEYFYNTIAIESNPYVQVGPLFF